MQILKSILLLLVGFLFLIKGADFFVDGSSGVAKKLKIPSLIIGLTIVAIGTSLPEFSVSLAAAITKNSALAVSNVIGSNIFNLLVVLGLSSIFKPLAVSRDIFKRDYPLSVLITFFLLIFSYIGMNLNRLEGISFILVLIIYLIVVVFSALKSRKNNIKKDLEESSYNEEQSSYDDIDERSMFLNLIFIIGGGIAIKFGGEWVVGGAVSFAEFFNIPQNIIGLTIVAIGTSLPELATSIVAARKGELDISVGNVIGSNIFNILGVAGSAAAVSQISIIYYNLIDIILLIVFSIITGIFCLTRKELEKKEGIIMICMYAIYNIYICIR